jgi:hypothetical protein
MSRSNSTTLSNFRSNNSKQAPNNISWPEKKQPIFSKKAGKPIRQIYISWPEKQPIFSKKAGKPIRQIYEGNPLFYGISSPSYSKLSFL